MKIRQKILLSLMAILGLTGIYFWPNRNWSVLPPIKDAEILRKDCKELSERFPLDDLVVVHTNKFSNDKFYSEIFRKRAGQVHSKIIPKDFWPESIKTLKPIKVFRDEYGVCIWLKELREPDKNHNWVLKGYFVHTNFKDSPLREPTHGWALYLLESTRYEGIDEIYVLAAVL